VLPELRGLAGAFVTPQLFIRFVIDVLDPIVMPPLEFGYAELGGDRIRISSRLRPGARPCEAFFRGSAGAARGMTAHLGLPLAKLVHSDVAPDRGIFELQLPPSRTLMRRARNMVMRLVLGAEPDGTPITMLVGSPDPDPARLWLDRAVRAWKLSPRQAEVLALVVTGLANKEIAQQLECADNTIELHVTRLLKKTGVSSRTLLIARFYSDDWS
jgi:DNA-binding CsgD family transcriptional regulator